MAAISAMVIALLVLIGWIFDLERLKRIVPSLVAMNPVTAICFILAGTALYAAHLRPGSIPRKFRNGCALLIISIGLLRLSAYLFNWEFLIDQLLFRPGLFEPETQAPNRMAPNTALSFTLLGFALLLIDRSIPRLRSLAPYLCLAVSLFSLLALTGYAFQTTVFYRVGGFIPMALHTAFTFLILSLGIASARPAHGLMETLTSDGVGATTARRLLPAAILLPLVLGWLRLHGEKQGLYDASFGVSLMAVCHVLIFTIVIWWNASLLNRADANRKTAEQQIRQLNSDLQRRAAQLESANKELEAFSYSVSHDLRAPLRHIAGFLQLIQKSVAATLDAKSQHYLKMIAESADEMGRLVDDLLAFSRMGRAEMRLALVPLNALLQETINDLTPDTAGRSVDWKIHSLPDVQADPALLRQVLVNLISNALKYSRTRARAEIEIGSIPSLNCEDIIFIRDNGVGFDMQYAGKLFGVFQRLHDSDRFEGTGIGLANVHRIIARHGGRTWAEAVVDRGATFYFSLPKPLPTNHELTETHSSRRG